MVELDEKSLENLYDWLDSIPFSRPKKNLARDFSDGVLAAELINHFFPGIIQLHNYPTSNAVAKKKINWETLSRKVLTKLDWPLSEHTIHELATAKRDATEYFLHVLRGKIDETMKRKAEKAAKLQSQRQVAYSPGKQLHERYNIPQYQEFSVPGIGTNKDHICSRQPSQWSAGGECSDNCPSHVSMQKRKDLGDGMEAERRAWIPHGAGFDSIPMAMYEQKEQEVLMREETIQILQARIRRLEHMIHLKDMRIEELNRSVAERKAGESAAIELNQIDKTFNLNHEPDVTYSASRVKKGI